MFHRTQRLFLRPAWPEDWRAVFDAVADEGLVKNLARAPWPYTEDDARAFVERAMDPELPSFLVMLPGEAGETLVGACGLGRDDRDAVQIGYWIAREHWGNGYASEAARGLLEVARAMGHRHIAGGHYVDNPGSGRVLEAIGFRPTGETHMESCLARGAKVPLVAYAIDLEEAFPLPPVAA